MTSTLRTLSFRIAVFYFLTWFCLILLGGIQQESGLFPAEVGLAQWGPGLAALLMLLIFRKDGHKISFAAKGVPASRYLYTALIPVGINLLVYLLSFLLPPNPNVAPLAYNSLFFLLLWMPLGALGEELGWRGYLHKKLDTRMRGLTSSVLVGILWMPIHVHFFAQGPLFLLFFTLLLIAYSIVIYALVQDSGFSVLLATIFHFAINLSNLLFLDIIYQTSFMALNAIVWVLVAAIIVWRKQDMFLARK